jgi:hypothetical protein
MNVKSVVRKMNGTMALILFNFPKVGILLLAVNTRNQPDTAEDANFPLELIIWELSGIDFQKGAAITAQLMGVFPRFKAILALLAQPGLASRKSLGTVVSRTIDLMNKSSGPGDKRNRIVHDPWYAYTASGKTAQFKAMPHKDHRYGIQLVDSEVLEDALRSIKEFSARVENLKKEISSLVSGS